MLCNTYYTSLLDNFLPIMGLGTLCEGGLPTAPLREIMIHSAWLFSHTPGSRRGIGSALGLVQDGRFATSAYS